MEKFVNIYNDPEDKILVVPNKGEKFVNIYDNSEDKIITVPNKVSKCSLYLKTENALSEYKNSPLRNEVLKNLGIDGTGISQQIFIVVDELPNIPEDINKIYVVPNEKGYSEYIWINNVWEPISSQQQEFIYDEDTYTLTIQ